MSRYRVYRPFGIRKRIKSYFNPFNIMLTISIWMMMFSIDLLKIIYKVIKFDIKYIVNYFHFRNINYSYNEIVKMIKEMSPREFEIFIAELYKYSGYKVELTPATCDGGKDIILWDDDCNMIYVEVKHYSESNMVGREICQKLLGAVAIDGADNGIVITTGKFHNNAIEVYNKVDNLELIDFEGIMQMIKRLDVYVLPKIFLKTFNSSDVSKMSFDY